MSILDPNYPPPYPWLRLGYLSLGGNLGLFAFKTDRKLKISIHNSVGVKIYAFRRAYRNLMTRDASGTREPGRKWDAGTGTQVGPNIFSDLKFEFLKTKKCFSKLDNFIAFSVLCVSLL